MAGIKEPQPVLPFIGVLSRDGIGTGPLIEQLAPLFGSVTIRSTPQKFTHTTYYNKEMGDRILRQWWVFDRIIDPAFLIDMKHASNTLEQHYQNDDGGRDINIDPGIITMSNVILASTKNYSHRIYLGKGIYAEVTLIFKRKTYTTLEWTYPDYKEPSTIDFFNQARTLLKDKLINAANY
ncbi:DUF4416 family protein [candidate division WOR-3 bacterium]|nr:DUF4416 family protein [candidate division WOR-3 bacterium]